MSQFSEESIELCCYWYDRPMIATEYARWVFGLLNTLKKEGGFFSNIYLLKKYKNEYKSTDLNEDEFEKLIFSNLSKENAYINPESSEKYLTPDSRCPLGFSSTFITAIDSNAPRFLIEVRIGKSLTNSVNTLIIRCLANDLESTFLAKIFQTLVKYSSPSHAHCWNQSLSKRIAQPVGDVYVGWLTYFSDSKIAELVNDIATVSPLEAGALISVGEQRVFSIDDSVVSNILAVVDRLGGSGYLADPRRRKT